MSAEVDNVVDPKPLPLKFNQNLSSNSCHIGGFGVVFVIFFCC